MLLPRWESELPTVLPRPETPRRMPRRRCRPLSGSRRKSRPAPSAAPPARARLALRKLAPVVHWDPSCMDSRPLRLMVELLSHRMLLLLENFSLQDRCHTWLWRRRVAGGQAVAHGVAAVAADDGDGLVGEVAGADGDDGLAGVELFFVVERFFLGDAQAGHRAEDAADGRARAGEA